MIHYSKLSIFILFIFLSIKSFAKESDQILVTSKRLSNSLAEEIYNTSRFNNNYLKSYPLSLDEILRRHPGFSLYRRQASRASHPSIQGANLRGLGPNGAGRALVVLDGIPLNDPFGGWIDWRSLPTLFIENVTIQNGGGAGPWGNRALSGVIRLDSVNMDNDNYVLDMKYGSKNTKQIDLITSSKFNNMSFFAGINILETDGYFGLRSDQKGSADFPLARSGETIRLGYTLQNTSGVKFIVSSQFSADNFQNGSLLAGSNSKDYKLSITVLKDDINNFINWEGRFFYRKKYFDTIFEAFDSTRNNSRPVLDQFDVPSDVIGGNLKFRWLINSDLVLENGIDFQLITGSTNENFRNLGNGFTRLRSAGGEQLLLGGFFETNLKLSDNGFVNLGLRADYWRQSNGYRKQVNIIDNKQLSENKYEAKDGVSINGRLGFIRNLFDYTDFNFSMYSSIRTPTLNELYRPFRVKNDITEANSNLKNEKMLGGEFSFTVDNDDYYFKVAFFRNDLFNPIVNTTISNAPGFNQLFNIFIPSGGSLRQRNNVSKVKTHGIETSLRLDIREGINLYANYLFSNPRISGNKLFNNLDGKRLAQTPKYQGNFGLNFRLQERINVNFEYIYSSSQFEDDSNTRILDNSGITNIFTNFSFSDNSSLYISLENIFNRRSQVGISKDGLISYGAPTFLWLGIRINK